MLSNLPILTFFAILAIGNHPSDGGPVSGGTTDFQPEFAEPLENLTVAIGRDATFTCVVKGLGGYRVGWVRADSKAIQAIHTHVITHNTRVSVSHADHTMWRLHIKAVKEEDRGSYMCQVNTDPMISLVANLEVVIPPEFVPEETSGDIMAPEGSTVKLTCKARGHPTPSIKWRREDGQNITIKSQGSKNQVVVHEGEILKLQKISRADMGTYLCIASNSVPPSISKRITVSVHFHPVIHVPNQLVGAPLNTDVTLECNVEAYPRSIHFWVKDQGSAMIISGGQYEVQEITKSMFEVKMILIIRKFRRENSGQYHCIAKNSLGDVDSVVKLHELKVDGDVVDRSGASNNNILDEDDDLDTLTSYEDMDSMSNNRNPNRNRQHTYSNRNNVIVAGAGGAIGRIGTGGTLLGSGALDHSSTNNLGGSGAYPSSGHRNNNGNSLSGGTSTNGSGGNNNNSRGKHSNYTPGGERERNNVPNNTNNNGDRERGRKERNRHTKRPNNYQGNKHLDNPLGPGNNNVYQTQMVPDGSSGSSMSSSAASSLVYSYTSTNNNNIHVLDGDHATDRNTNRDSYNKYSIISCNCRDNVHHNSWSYYRNQLSSWFLQKYYNSLPLVIGGWGLALQMLQIAGSTRHW